MKKQLMELLINRFLCPFCGKWHEINDETYDDENNSIHTVAKQEPGDIWCVEYSNYFTLKYDDKYVYVNLCMCCDGYDGYGYSVNPNDVLIEFHIPFDSFVEDGNAPIVTAEFTFEAASETFKNIEKKCGYATPNEDSIFDADDCRGCAFCSNPNILNQKHKFKIGFEFSDKELYFLIHNNNSK